MQSQGRREGCHAQGAEDGKTATAEAKAQSKVPTAPCQLHRQKCGPRRRLVFLRLTAVFTATIPPAQELRDAWSPIAPGVWGLRVRTHACVFLTGVDKKVGRLQAPCSQAEQVSWGPGWPPEQVCCGQVQGPLVLCSEIYPISQSWLGFARRTPCVFLKEL